MKSQSINLSNETAPFFPPEGKGVRYMDSLQEFMTAFKYAWDNTNNEFLKYEDRQTYIEDGDVSLEHYLAGRKIESIDTLRDGFEDEEKNFQLFKEKGARHVRVRPYIRPLSPYLQWEILTYQLSSSLGQEILLFEDSAIADVRREFGICDFLIFDDHHVIVHNYTVEGRLVGGWLVKSHAHISRYRQLFDEILGHSKSLAEFLTDYPELKIPDAT